MSAVNISPEVLRAASEWRTSRSQQSLNWLYWNFINLLPADQVPISTVVDLLGEPTNQISKCYYFVSLPGPMGQASLYLEADNQGVLSCWGMD